MHTIMIQDFIDNQVIRYLAPKPFWTVNIDGKKPLDIIEYQSSGHIRGAKDDGCLTNLSSLFRIVNNVPAQFVYSLNAVRDKIVILDIEKTCPDDIKQTLLNLPFIYGDISMSGQGLHLVFPCPPLDEITINKVAMKEEHGYYEVLIHHYVSFTNFTIFPRFTAENAPIQFQEIWDALKETQKNTMKREFNLDIDDEDLDFPQYPIMRETILRNFRRRFTKQPSDFHNDMSRYEFAVIGSIRYSLSVIKDLPMFARHVRLSETQQVAIVYDIAKSVIEYRAKHDEIRDGKPMLLYQVINSFATSYDDSQRKT